LNSVQLLGPGGYYIVVFRAATVLPCYIDMSRKNDSRMTEPHEDNRRDISSFLHLAAIPELSLNGVGFMGLAYRTVLSMPR